MTESDIIKLRVIGNGDAFCTSGKNHTCFLIEFNNRLILIDFGSTSYSELKKQNIPVNRIDTIILSHLHGDHIGAIPFLLTERAYAYDEEEISNLKIVGPGPVKERLSGLQEILYPNTSENAFNKCDIQNYVDFKDDFIELSSISVNHSKLSFPHAVRIKINDRIICYSGDTEWTDKLIEIAKDSDLFICECFSYSEKITGHLRYIDIIENIKGINAKRMVLTHCGPDLLNHLDKVNLEVLIPLQTITI